MRISSVYSFRRIENDVYKSGVMFNSCKALFPWERFEKKCVCRNHQHDTADMASPNGFHLTVYTIHGAFLETKGKINILIERRCYRLVQVIYHSVAESYYALPKTVFRSDFATKNACHFSRILHVPSSRFYLNQKPRMLCCGVVWCGDGVVSCMTHSSVNRQRITYLLPC